MKTSRVELAKIISDKIDKGIAPSKLAKEIAAYLLEERRINELNSLIRDVINYRAEKGFKEVDVISAHDITKAIETEIKKYAGSIDKNTKSVVLNSRINKSLIGGLKLEIDASKLLDLSVRAKFNNFKQLINQGKV